MITLISFLIQIIALAALYILLRPLINGAVYFPTTYAHIEVINELAQIQPGDEIVDLGSGDGRIMLALAKAGAKVTGYEINPLLVWYTRQAIKRAGLESQAKVYWKSFWRADLSKFNTIIVYGFPPIMDRLKNKLERELKPQESQNGNLTKIISNQYAFPGWIPASTEKNVYLYIHK